MKMYMALVKRTLYLHPPKPEPRLDLSRHNPKERPRLRMLSRMLNRVNLDMRHVFHDPRGGHSNKKILGRGSAHLFREMVLRQGKRVVQAKELTEKELDELKAYQKSNKTKVKLSNPAEKTVDLILPSVTPLGFSSDSDFDSENSDYSDSDEDQNDPDAPPRAESLNLSVRRRKLIRRGRRVPPKEWHTEQSDVPRMKAPPGMVALPARDPSRGNKSFYNYNGRWRDGRPHGHGKIILATSNRPDNGEYEGDWENGQPHGVGVRRFRNGCVYEGQYKEGLMHGMGVMKGRDGFVMYEGQWKDGKRHGQGRQATRAGVVYEGGWMKGMKEGHGVIKNKRGTTYTGVFEEDEIWGPGTLQLEGPEQIANHHTQRFLKYDWYGMRLPETIRYLRKEVIGKREAKLAEQRELTRHLDERALALFVQEARDLIEEERARELEDLAAAKRKELNDRREELQKKRQEMLDSLKAEVGGGGSEDSDEYNSDED